METFSKPITVQFSYTLSQREQLRQRIKARQEALGCGAPLFCKEIQALVGMNADRIRRPGGAGICVDQLGYKNVYHFLEGRRTQDHRMQIFDAYLQLIDEATFERAAA